jgi:21S rRNA (GM2251-2'-O)-methyltransferase
MENTGIDALVARAREAKVKIHHVGDEYLRIMDKASGGRPHNGFILESSPLPKPPITKLAEASRDSASFQVQLDKQSQEDLLVNGKQNEYEYKAAGWRYPLLLYVDGVLDEGNLGAIARSAYFLGVDAIATPSRQSAPWSQIALKASAGGAEAVPIFTVNKPSDFLAESARSGWRIYASDAIAPEQQLADITAPPASRSSEQDFSSNIIFTYARNVRRIPPGHCPVEEHPTILMMGAEGTGLRPSLLSHAHYKVGIRAGRQTNEIGVDSLNVSVAASLLCFEFLKKPIKTARTGGVLF